MNTEQTSKNIFTYNDMKSQFSPLIPLFRMTILHFSIPNSMHMSEPNILTGFISESRSLSVFHIISGRPYEVGG